tara:strand:- start:18 stop:542 length:525 start_codon:yes stop_codon:yes gene_type:complete
MSATQPDKPVTASLDQLSKMLPILNAKPGDVFAHAGDKGNHRNPDGWFDVLVFKGIHDQANPDPELFGWSRDLIPDGWLLFHWHPDNPGLGRMLYQAGAYRYGIAIIDPIDGIDPVECGGRPRGIALPREDCWGMRMLEEFGCQDEEIWRYKRKEDTGIVVRKKARRMMPERAN